MLDIYTIQLAKWRLLKDRSIELIDTTVKSGDPAFAPTWDMVTQIKSGALTEETYRRQYIALMKETVKTHRASWEALIRKPAIALACYCPPHHFCHRLVLYRMVMYYAQLNEQPCQYLGEITQ